MNETQIYEPEYEEDDYHGYVPHVPQRNSEGIVEKYHKFARTFHLLTIAALAIMLISTILPGTAVITLFEENLTITDFMDDTLTSSYKTYAYVYFGILIFAAITPLYGLNSIMQEGKKIKTCTSAYFKLMNIRDFAVAIAISGTLIVLSYIKTSFYHNFASGALVLIPLVIAVVSFLMFFGLFYAKGSLSLRTMKSQNAESAPYSEDSKNPAMKFVRETTFNSCLFVIEALISIPIFLIFAYTIKQAKDTGMGLLEPGIALYVNAALSAAIAIGSLYAASTCNYTKKLVDQKPNREDFIERIPNAFCLNLILVTVLFSLLSAYCWMNRPFSKIIMQKDADSIELGMTKTDISDILDLPSMEEENTWYYFDKGFERKYNKIKKVINESQDLEDLDEVLEAYDKIDGAKYSYIEVKFNENDEVTRVSYGKNRIYDAIGDNEDTCKKIKAIEFYDKKGKKIKELDVFDHNNQLTLLTDLSECSLVIKFNDDDFIKRPYGYYNLVKENGIYYFDVHENEVAARAKIKTRVHEIDKNGVLNFNEGITVITSSILKDISPSLSELHIPASVTKIEKDAFLNIKSIDKVYIEDLSKWCKIEFGNEYSNPLTYAKKMYVSGEETTLLNIPDETVRISDYAFFNADFITSVSIPDSVIYVGAHTFDGVSEAEENVDGIIYIDNWLINATNTAQTLNLKNEIRGIASNPGFNKIENLTTITLPSTIQTIPDNCFSQCTKLEEVISLGNVRSIGKSAFYGCSALESLTVTTTDADPSIESIGEQAFYNCSSLTSVMFNPKNDANLCLNFPTSLKSIEKNAFYGCTSIGEVHAPNLRYLGESAFEDCGGITVFDIGGNPVFEGTSVIPKNVVNLRASAAMVETISHSKAVEIIVEGGDNFKSEFTASSRLKTLEFRGIKTLHVDLVITKRAANAVDDGLYYPENAELNIKIGKSISHIMFDLDVAKNDVYSVEFEKFGEWYMIDTSKFIPKIEELSKKEVAKYITTNVKHNYSFQKVESNFVFDILLNKNNEAVFSAVTVIIAIGGLIIFALLTMIAAIMSPSRKKKKALKRGETKTFSNSYCLAHKILTAFSFLLLAVMMVLLIVAQSAF